MSCKVLRSNGQYSAAPFPWVETESIISTARFATRAPASAKRAAEKSSAQQEEAAEAAIRKAYADGAAAAREEVEASVRPVVERMGAAIAKLADVRAKARREAENDLVQLAISIARRLVHRELSIDPESVRALARVALEKLAAGELVRVRIHPEQRELMERLIETYTAGRAVELVDDASLLAGDAVYETLRGSLDARVDSQLDEIERGFTDRLRRTS